MRVRDIMKTNLVTIEPQQTVGEARELMRRHGIRHLPVIVGKKPQGMLSDRDTNVPALLQGSKAEEWLDGVDVAQAMSKPAVVVTPEESVGVAANRMRGNKLGSLAVVDGDDGRIVGIVTEVDALEVLSKTATSSHQRPTVRARGGKR